MNVSAICQAALREELDNRSAREKDMQRVRLFDEKRGDLSFIGREIYKDGRLKAYLTARNRIAIYMTDRAQLSDYDRISEIPKGTYDPRFLSTVKKKLGGEFDETTHLDI